MVFSSFESGVKAMGDVLWGWPLLALVAISGVAWTVLLRGIQARYFFASFRYLIFPERGGSSAAVISPMQAFLNTLSASVGNGSLTGMATAIYSGGPGAALWVALFGLISMPIRFAEVFCSTAIATRHHDGKTHGGPLAYIAQVPGGTFLTYVYLFGALALTFFSGCGMQCQSITGGIVALTQVSPVYVGLALFSFLVYVLAGGAARVLRVSDVIVPVKVLLFFALTGYAFVYHAHAIMPALALIVASACNIGAVKAGVVGFAIQESMRFALARVVNATEAGLGTSGILYGATGTVDPVRSGIMAMATSFVSNYLVCFALMVLIVASGAWQSGIQGVGMTICAYETVYGAWGSIAVTLLSMMFGLGVMVAYIYIGRECWSFLTKGRLMWLYSVLFCACALMGSLAEVSVLWNLIDISNAFLVAINMYALWHFVPHMRKAVAAYDAGRLSGS